MANKTAKQIHLSPEAVKVLTIEAVRKGKVFKHYVEELLEDTATRLAKKEKA